MLFLSGFCCLGNRFVQILDALCKGLDFACESCNRLFTVCDRLLHALPFWFLLPRQQKPERKSMKKAIADGEESIATLASEIKALTKGIKDLDKSVAEATETRKEEH